MRTLHIEHVTEYRFEQFVTLLPHRLLIQPRESRLLQVVSHTLDIHPAHEIRWSSDALDNAIADVSFQRASDHLRIRSRAIIQNRDDAPLDFVVHDHAVMHPFAYAAQEAELLVPFCNPSWSSDRTTVQQWLSQLGLLGTSMQTYTLLHRLNLAIHTQHPSSAREEPGVWSPAQTLANRHGACRDLAALFIEACRALGLAARFVSGYLHSPESERGFGTTHAWAEVYIPGPGWKGFDPTLGELTGNRHIAVAVASHGEHVPPISGSFQATSPTRPTMHVQVTVQEQIDASAPAAR